ncbi:MAG: WD40/YVTN/BNR-like repeat-containing protein, partial [Nevskiales bacterium]
GGPFEADAAGLLFAFGAFGQFLISTDGGRHWEQSTLNVAEDEAEVEATTQTDTASTETDDIFGMGDSGGDDYDPFAAFESGALATDYTSRHIYDMAQARDGSLFLVGERGMILRSADAGETWEAMDEIYTGSFYGITPLANDSLLVYGMRGHAFVSSDLGASWQASNVPLVQGLYDAAVDSSGMIVVAGGSNSVLVSSDHGASFVKASQRGPNAFASILTLGKNRWLLAGEGGVGKKSMFNTVPVTPAPASTGDAS